MAGSFGFLKTANLSDHSTEGEKCILNTSVYQRIFQNPENNMSFVKEAMLSKNHSANRSPISRVIIHEGDKKHDSIPDLSPSAIGINGIKINKSFHIKYVKN